MGAAILDAVYGSTPVPLQVPGLILWLKADTGTFQNTTLTTPAVANADPIGGWQDQSGTGNHVTQATSTKRPTLRLAVQNGLPAVRFDGVDDFLSKTFAASLAQPVTLFMACTGQSATSKEFWDSDTAHGCQMNTGGTATQIGIRSSTTTTYNSQTPGALHQYTILLSGASTVLRADGVAQAGVGSTGSLNMPGIFLAEDANGAGQMAIDYYEFLIYSGNQSAYFAMIESYLKGRWATP